VLRTDDPAMTSTGLVNHRDRGHAERSVPALDHGEYLAIEDGEDIVILPLSVLVLRIGRSPAAGLTLDDATVSRRHAVLLRDDTGTRVLDDRSLNGTWVNDERVTEALLRDGDVIALGRVRLHYLKRA
jgi:pSer/pThr/pTyr-binding forkhead associated (FHA) protein